MNRVFIDKPAVRESVPLLIGLMGCSGSGKTYSALRLATGIQRVTGGDIYCIDTEARRALHYADQFKFRHLEFNAPFGSLDYLAAMQHCIKQGAKTIIIDSMTHEHTGPGGYLQTQDAEVARMAGEDMAKRERVKMAAWIKPSALRGKMITELLQMNANFLFCFRAKEKTKPVKGGGIVEMGFMPIAGEDLLFEMTLNCLLPPRSNGVPQWRSDAVGEKMMMKLPEQFADLLAKSRSLDENLGQAFALWAKGDKDSPVAAPPVDDAAPPHQPPSKPRGGAAEPDPEAELTAAEWDMLLGVEAAKGTAALRDLYRTIPKIMRPQLEAALDRRHLPTARKVDEQGKMQ